MLNFMLHNHLPMHPTKVSFLFVLQCCREVAEKYPEIKYEEVVIDNCCMMV